MPANYVLLEKITVGAAGASSVTFSGIPQTGYTDLVVKISGRASNPYIDMTFNGSGTSWTNRYLYGNGSSAGSGTQAKFLGIESSTSNTASTFGSGEIYIPNYTSSNYKSFSAESVQETNASSAEMYMTAGLWSNTAAITSIEIYPESSGTWSQYSTFYLYGVAKLGTTPAIVPYATGGDTIMTDGTYWYHAFLASGTFTPATGKSLSCDVLVVAGGGGTGSNFSAGAGAGGLLTFTSQSITSNKTVTVGAGGAGNASGVGTNGADSIFGALTTAVGGGNGMYNGSSEQGGSTGGSGGGKTNSQTTGFAGTSGQGNAGGGGSGTTNGGTGGGGGAGAVGTQGTFAISGAGGVGSSTAISGGATTAAGQLSGGIYYFAGGGGGGAFDGNQTAAGAAGLGGGGAGARGIGAPVNANPGTANTGGGAGGASAYSAPGANGGSGIVIVRYAV